MSDIARDREESLSARALRVLEAEQTVFSEFVGGMWEETSDHPLKLAGEAAIGAAITTALGRMSPELAAGAAIAGVAVGGYQLARAACDFVVDNTIVAQGAYGQSPAEINGALRDIRSMGAAFMDNSVVALGGAAAFEAGRISSALRGVAPLVNNPYPLARGLYEMQGAPAAGYNAFIKDSMINRWS